MPLPLSTVTATGLGVPRRHPRDSSVGKAWQVSFSSCEPRLRGYDPHTKPTPLQQHTAYTDQCLACICRKVNSIQSNPQLCTRRSNGRPGGWPFFFARARLTTRSQPGAGLLYRGYEILACVQRAEQWSLDDNGQLRALLGSCPAHDGYSVMYEVVDSSGNQSVSQMASVDSAKAWIDASILAQEGRGS
jgi:hypothetical protein